MKLNKSMLLVLIAGISFTGIVQAVSGRYYNTKIQSIEAMLNGKKTMDYAATKKNLDELRIALKNEAKNSDRYKRFASAEKEFNALSSTRSAASSATAPAASQAASSAAAPAASQALIPLSTADEAEALVAAAEADQGDDESTGNDYQAPMNGNMDSKHKADTSTAHVGSEGADQAAANAAEAEDAATVARAAAVGIDLMQLDLDLNSFDNAISVGEKTKNKRAKDAAQRQAQAFYDRLQPILEKQDTAAAIGKGRVSRFNALEARFKNL